MAVSDRSKRTAVGSSAAAVEHRGADIDGASVFPDAPWRAQRGRATRSAKARRPLTVKRIVDVALAIIDAEGTEAVTMRRVAGKLHVGASSLYVHVANRQDLLMLVRDRVNQEVGLPLHTGDWQADLKRQHLKLQETLCRHSDVATLFFANVPADESAMRGFEMTLGQMIEAGIPPQVATWGLDRLLLYTVADAYEGWRFGDMYAQQADFVRPIREYFQSLSPSEFPVIRANAEALLSGESTQRYEFGLDILLAGIASHTRHDKSAEPNKVND